MEHIFRLFFPQMVDEQDGDAVGIRNPFQNREVAVIVGVGCVASRTNHLKGVDDNQHGVGVGSEEHFYLFLQSLADEVALRAEVDAVWRVLGNFKQPVLDAEDGILQAEIEGGTLLGGHVPDRFSLGNCHRQP